MKTDADAANSKREIDDVMAAFFRAVSFDEGEKPAYAELYDIFVESGQFIKNTGEAPEIATVRQFIEPRQRLADSGELTGFREWETAEITELFGNIAHRFSAYEKAGVSAGNEVSGRGIISTQFIATPTGWKISALVWDDERPGLTIPERYQ